MRLIGFDDAPAPAIDRPSKTAQARLRTAALRKGEACSKIFLLNCNNSSRCKALKFLAA
jgi:hypothetical protein